MAEVVSTSPSGLYQEEPSPFDVQNTAHFSDSARDGQSYTVPKRSLHSRAEKICTRTMNKTCDFRTKSEACHKMHQILQCVSTQCTEKIFLFRNALACAHPGIPPVAARVRVPKMALRRQGRR